MKQIVKNKNIKYVAKIMNKKTSIYDLHVKNGGKIVSFAGYDMPIQYKDGVIQEHEWVRSKVGIFDVSHMGQLIVEGEGAIEFFEKITPSLFSKAADKTAKYTVLTNEKGGIIDDLIITKISASKFFVVINAACKEKDIAWMEENLPDGVSLTRLDDRSLIAVQGVQAQSILSYMLSDVDLEEQNYMTLEKASYKGEEIFISRLGYTGEDGFEISVSNEKASDLWDELTQNPDVKEIGLGARDTLRLEMGYPLYGHDIDSETSPIDADLSWVVSKSNDNFFGSERIKKEKAEGSSKKRVGIELVDKGVAREGAEIYNKDGKKIGIMTSGGFSPTLKKSIGQGYVEIDFAKEGEEIFVKVRNRDIKSKVAKMPFIAAKTKAMKKK